MSPILIKKQFLLHCSVKDKEDQNRYIYHSSDDLAHNFAFTDSIGKYVLQPDPKTKIIRLKYDK